MPLGTRISTGLGNFSIQTFPCLSFDGVDDYVSIPDNPNLDINLSLTVSAWAKHNDASISGYETIVSKYGAGGVEWGISINGSGYIYLFFSGDGVSPNFWVSGSPVTINQWNHYAFSYAGTPVNSVEVYLNGSILAGSFILGSLPSSLHNGTADLEIGRYDENFYWEGQICDVRIIPAALGSSGINTIYTGGNEGSPAAWYPLNEGSGSVATDVSVNGNNGTLTNFNLTNAWANTQDVFYYA